MKIRLLYVAYAMIALCTIACTSQENPESMIEEELGIIKFDEDAIEGSSKSGNSTLSYSAVKTSNDAYLYSVTIDGHKLSAELFFTHEAIKLHAGNFTLNESQKSALLDFSRKLFTYVDNGEGTIALSEYGLIRLMEYWSNAPTNHLYTDYSIGSTDEKAQIAGRLGNEGITCIRKGTYVNAEYDDSRGTRSDRVKVGSKARNGYGCMGRCGADCGRWWIPSAWTKDCMDHDQCSNVNNSSGGSSDRNCGDEFNEAADDWAFGVIRGCRG
ncbi:MAG: hypothetical protein AAFO69_11740 [Bacteroidota bacterium]